MTVVETGTSPLSIREDVAPINQSFNADTWDFCKFSSVLNAHVLDTIYIAWGFLSEICETISRDDQKFQKLSRKR